MKKLFIGAGMIALIALLLNFQVVRAHEEITVGDYMLEVGWLSEPPVAGQQNAIVLHVTQGEGQPVEDVSTLVVIISYGGQEKMLALQPAAEDAPCRFVAPLLPTVPGQYTLKLSGSLGDTTIEAEVEPEEVQPADTLQFPNVSSPEAGAQNADLGMLNWLLYLSLLIGLTALTLAVMALRKTNR